MEPSRRNPQWRNDKHRMEQQHQRDLLNRLADEIVDLTQEVREARIREAATPSKELPTWVGWLLAVLSGLMVAGIVGLVVMYGEISEIRGNRFTDADGAVVETNQGNLDRRLRILEEHHREHH